jgi:chemotaxis protein histidine kinase CheA
MLQNLEWILDLNFSNGCGALSLFFRRIFGGKCIQCNVKTTHTISSTNWFELMRKNETAGKVGHLTDSTPWASFLRSAAIGKGQKTGQGSSSSVAQDRIVSARAFAVFVCDSSCKKEFVAEWENIAIEYELELKTREEERLERQEEARLKREAWEEEARLKSEAAMAQYHAEQEKRREAREEEARIKREAIEEERLEREAREEEARLEREAREEEARRKAVAVLANIKREEDAALAKKQAAALDKRLKQKQVQEERLLKAKEKQALENKNSILNLLMEQDVHPDFISDLTENISASVMIRYEFRDVLLSLWTPLGKPKKNSAYHYWQGWVLANADYSVDIEETKSSILKLIKTTIHEMQKLIPDIMDLAISIDDFHRLVGLWEKHDHLGHNVISRIFQGENETFVLADIDALQS